MNAVPGSAPGFCVGRNPRSGFRRTDIAHWRRNRLRRLRPADYRRLCPRRLFRTGNGGGRFGEISLKQLLHDFVVHLRRHQYEALHVGRARLLRHLGLDGRLDLVTHVLEGWHHGRVAEVQCTRDWKVQAFQSAIGSGSIFTGQSLPSAADAAASK